MCLVEVDVDPLQLDIAISLIDARCVDAMFFTDHLPELQRQKPQSATNNSLLCPVFILFFTTYKV